MSYGLAMDELLVKERWESRLREAEQERLLRAVRGSRKSRGWRLQVTEVLENLSVHFPTVFSRPIACSGDPAALEC